METGRNPGRGKQHVSQVELIMKEIGSKELQLFDRKAIREL